MSVGSYVKEVLHCLLTLHSMWYVVSGGYYTALSEKFKFDGQEYPLCDFLKIQKIREGNEEGDCMILISH